MHIFSEMVKREKRKNAFNSQEARDQLRVCCFYFAFAREVKVESGFGAR
jgi:hypothetical protein